MKIKLYSYAKINLALNIGNVMADGMHPADTIMQQLALHDEIEVETIEDGRGDIIITSNKEQVPLDATNLAYRGALLIRDTFSEDRPSEESPGILTEEQRHHTIKIHIQKNIPIAAGLAGGSGNGAAVMHALNVLWDLDLSLEELCHLGKSLGADVPFCIAGQAAVNENLPDKIKESPLASFAARGRGVGADLSPCRGFTGYVVLAKPDMGVSTKEVYQGYDSCVVTERPDVDALEEDLRRGAAELTQAPALALEAPVALTQAATAPEAPAALAYRAAASNMINTLECYTLNAKEEVRILKSKMEELSPSAIKVLMSGSGPTVFALFLDKEKARDCHEAIRALGYESYLTESRG